MSDCIGSLAPDICPDVDACHRQIIAQLPRGRAWETPRDSTRWRFLRALAVLVAYANARICAMIAEFFCQSQTETTDWWMRQYGLPDACDPFPDLCSKVAAQGGTRCEYFQDIAARAGWSIRCLDPLDVCGARADCARADCARAGNSRLPSDLAIYVDLGASPAFSTPLRALPLADRMRADQYLGCGPDLTPLVCLMSRIVPAHVRTIYEAH